MKAIYFGAIFTMILSGCAKRINSIDDVEKFRGEGIGYVAFSYQSNDSGSIELEVKSLNEKGSFVFDLTKINPSTLQFFVGPFVVYKKEFEKKTDPYNPRLKLVPLPSGKYVCKYLRYHEQPSKNILRNIAGIAPVSLTWFTVKDTFEIKSEKSTYIGSFDGQIQYLTKLPNDIKVIVSDELDVRAKEVGLSADMQKQLCKLKQ